MTETARVPSSSPDSRLPTRESRRSLIPFMTGDQVIEAIGPMCMRTHDLVSIIEHGADHCVTQTGHVYTRRGTSIPRDDEPYRSITSPDYAQDWQPSPIRDFATRDSRPPTPPRQDGDAQEATDGDARRQT